MVKNLMVTLQYLDIVNFKGIKELRVDFSNITNISGDNGTCKTTLKDSTSWLLFGKDSNNRSNHEIRPKNIEGKTTRGMITSIEGGFTFGERSITFRRTYREKMVLKKGEVEKEFKGYETLFEVDGVACSQSSFNEKVNGFLKEELFKILINPSYFTELKWDVQREHLVDMAGVITVLDVIRSDGELEEIREELLKLPIEDIIKKYKADVLKIKRLILESEVRIDECTGRLMKLDFKYIKNLLVEKERELNILNGEEGKRNRLRLEEIKDEGDSLKRRGELFHYEVVILEEKLKELREKTDVLRLEWEDFSKVDYLDLENCPYCQRVLTEEFLKGINEDRESLLERRKEEKFKEINHQGMLNLKEIERIEEERGKILDIISNLDIRSARIKDELEKINLTLDNVGEERNVELRIFELQGEVKKLRQLLGYECFNNDITLRIGELNEDIELNKRKRADYEKILLLCERFVRCKISLLEDRINSRFSLVKFKLFHEQINGGVVECCECTFNGVPFSVLNTASRVNCGLDIINAFSANYKVTPFVFIDGRESVNEIIKMAGQVINLRVTRDESLVIKNVEGPKNIKRASGICKIRKLDF